MSNSHQLITHGSVWKSLHTGYIYRVNRVIDPSKVALFNLEFPNLGIFTLWEPELILSRFIQVLESAIAA